MSFSIRFYIKDKKAEKTPIYFLLSIKTYEVKGDKKRYTPIKQYIGHSVNPLHWIQKKGRVKELYQFPENRELNNILVKIESDVALMLRSLIIDEIPISKELIKSKLNILLSQKIESKENDTFEGFIDYYIEVSNTREGTKKSYKMALSNIKEYQSKYKIKLSFDNIDMKFYNNFTNLLKNKGYSPNTIGTRIKIIKSLMQAALNMKLHNNSTFKDKAFKKPSEKTESIYLTNKELDSIFNLDLSKDKKLDKVRDWFLIGCYTGFRFSDLQELNINNINNGILSKTTVKTKTKVSIPVHKRVEYILNKYGGELPKLMSNQKFNKYIKDVCEQANIDSIIRIGNTDYKKNKLISAHTARRTFATNAYLSKIPSISIMKMTGHKTESAFLKYIKMDDTENAISLKDHDFFKD